MLTDGDGLWVVVAPSGVKSWHLRRKKDGKETLQVIGQYSAISLAAARAKRDEIKAKASSVTLDAVVRAWHAAQRRRWTPHHFADVIASLEREILPQIGNTPITEIDAPKLLKILRPIQARTRANLPTG